MRNFLFSDLVTFVAYRNDPDVAKYQSWKRPVIPQQALDFIKEHMTYELGVKGKWHQLALELKVDGTHIGDCAIHTSTDGKQAEFGITLAKAYHQKGYALEALTVLFEYLFRKLHYHRITALVDSENINSLELMKKLGMRQEAYFKESYFSGLSTWTDEVQFAILEKEFLFVEKEI